MTRWLVRTDVAQDAVVGAAETQEHPVVDIVPVTPWLDLHVERSRSERLVAFSVEGVTRARQSGFDLRWFGRLVGRPLAEAVWDALSGDHSASDDGDRALVVEVEEDERRDLRRLNHLLNVVQAAGWAGERGWQMADGWTVGDLLGPLDVSRDAMGSAEWLVRGLLEHGTEGRAETRVRDLDPIGRPGGEIVNLIPSDHMGPCADVLIALCFDADNLERRLNEAIKHAGIHCPATRAVVFITSKWDPKVWVGLERDVTVLRAMFMVIMCGPSGQLARLR